MTLTKPPNPSQSFRERASIAIAEKYGVDDSIPKILVFFDQEWTDLYLKELEHEKTVGRASSRANIVALDTVLRKIRTTMADEWSRTYAYLGWCTIYSTRLEEEVILCRDDMVAQICREEKPGIAVYTEKELEQLLDISDDELRTLHNAHTIFTGKFIDPESVGKTDQRDHGTEKKNRFRYPKKKNSKYARYKKSNSS